MKDLDNQSVKELRRMAHDLHIKKWYSLKKAELLEAMAKVKIMTSSIPVSFPGCVRGP